MNNPSGEIFLGSGSWAGKAERSEASAWLLPADSGWLLRLSVTDYNLYAADPSRGNTWERARLLPPDITPEELVGLIRSASGVTLPAAPIREALDKKT